MNLRDITALLATGLLLGASSQALGQQEKSAERTVTLPDSLKGTLSTKADEGLIRKNWGKLKRGMTSQQVEHVFGKPTKVASDLRDSSTTWYYGARFVVFDTIKGTVRSWSAN